MPVIVMLHIMVAGLAVFLIGCNTAFLIHLRSRLVAFFFTKIAATTLLLLYVAMSVTWGAPTTWRVVVGLVAVLVDILALFRMWGSIIESAEHGVIGLVPILRDPIEDHRRSDDDSMLR